MKNGDKVRQDALRALGDPELVERIAQLGHNREALNCQANAACDYHLGEEAVNEWEARIASADKELETLRAEANRRGLGD